MKNKKILLILLALFVLVALGLFGWRQYGDRRESRYSIVRLSGASVAMNYSHIFAPASFMVETLGHGPSLLLWDKDIYMIEGETGSGFFMVYSREDGDSLSLQIKDFLLFLAGKPVGINIESGTEEEALDWLDHAKDEEIRSLRFLAIDPSETGAVDPPDAKLLQRIARLNPHIGLGLKSSDLAAILPYFKPNVLWISVDTPFSDKEKQLLLKQDNLEVLSLGNEAQQDYAFLRSLVRLRQLAISNADLERLPTFPPSLRSLSLSTCAIEDVSSLASLRQLRALSLYDCTLKDPKPLSRLRDLLFLNLGATELSDTSLFDPLRRLKYLAAPKGMSQTSFVSLSRVHPNLEILQLGSPAIKDLGPLKQMRRLRALIITVDKDADKGFFDARTIQGMKDLRYLALSEDLVPDEKAGQELQKALPNCQITFARNICLGSGWILIFWPAVLLALGVFSYREKLSK